MTSSTIDQTEAVEQLGFEQERYVDRSVEPWRELEGIKFYAATLVGQLPGRSSGCC